jgi:uncharacterized membrane protein
MKKNRLEAFSDGVLAIVITIMVLELKVPHGEGFDALAPLAPVFLSYILSFVYISIYWNNHHHMFQIIERVNGGVLWSNLHLLFWLTLLPFSTGWMGENHFARIPTMLYGLNLLACAVAYYILQTCLVSAQGPEDLLSKAIGRDFKGKASPIFYLAGLIGTWFFSPWLGLAAFVGVALMWLVPDRRMERALYA